MLIFGVKCEITEAIPVNPPGAKPLEFAKTCKVKATITAAVTLAAASKNNSLKVYFFIGKPTKGI